MALSLSPLVAPNAMSMPAATEKVFSSVWRAPLVPVALAVTAGIVADRCLTIPASYSLSAAGAGLVAWAVALRSRQPILPLIFLALVCTSVGAAYHHWRSAVFSPDDIGEYAGEEPQLVAIRGVLEKQPVVVRQAQADLRSYVWKRTRSIIGVKQIRRGADWVAATGRARLVVMGQMGSFKVGDGVEVVGWLETPRRPMNPGEFDYAAYLLDQGIRAQIVVNETNGSLMYRPEDQVPSVERWLAAVRGWGEDVLRRDRSKYQYLAAALLLGDVSAMTDEEKDEYLRTGVIHVLAISGQHLVLLGGLMWWLLRLLGIRQRRGALVVTVFLIFYVLLTGGRPAGLRSAVMVTVVCGGLLLRRMVLPANSLALAWLVVAGLDPADLFTMGCQFSFLGVAALYWGARHWLRSEPDPLNRLIEESRPNWQKGLLWLGRPTALSYGLTLLVWLAVAPLVAAHQHIVSPVGILIGPPVVLLTTVALIAGFLLLAAAAVFSFLVPLFAFVTQGSLAACDFLVDKGLRLPGAYWYVGDIPEWWLWVFYAGLLAALTQEPLRRHWRWVALAGVAWLCVGLLASGRRLASDELRITFLAVGHGSCTVLETPDGRTLLYDAGAMTGPEVTRRQIAPFLLHRGVRRIDEVFLSHADLDHFNGLPDLLDYFAVGQVTCTPTFTDRPTPGVKATVAALERRGIAVRTVCAGDRLTAGTAVIDVLHPPSQGPEGVENVRSLVLLVQYAGHAVLLTGDLEGAGLDRVLGLPAPAVDVLMAPHHGSRTANKPERIMKWVRPQVVVSCQGPKRGSSRLPNPYEANGTIFLPTSSHGAVTVQSRPGELEVETFATQQRWQLRPRRRKSTSPAPPTGGPSCPRCRTGSSVRRARRPRCGPVRCGGRSA